MRVLRFGVLLALVAVMLAALVQAASADPTHAKNSQVITATCGQQQILFSVNGTGVFTPRPRDWRHGDIHSDRVRPHVLDHTTRRPDRNRDRERGEAESSEGDGD